MTTLTIIGKCITTVGNCDLGAMIGQIGHQYHKYILSFCFLLCSVAALHQLVIWYYHTQRKSQTPNCAVGNDEGYTIKPPRVQTPTLPFHYFDNCDFRRSSSTHGLKSISGKVTCCLKRMLRGELVRESLDTHVRWTDRRNITEISLKTALNCNQSTMLFQTCFQSTLLKVCCVWKEVDNQIRTSSLSVIFYL